MLDTARRSSTFAACALALLAAACSPSGGHDHGPGGDHGPHGEEAEELNPVVVTVFTNKVELFMEYPRMTPGSEARFLAHVTVLANGDPVKSGKLRLVVTGEGGSKTFETPKPARDGLFIPVGSLERPGTYAAKITVESEQVTETIELPPIVVYADLAAATAAAKAEAVDDPPDAVPFLLEQQWKIGMLMTQAKSGSLTRRLRVAGRIEAPPGSLAVVSAPFPGRIQPPASGMFPRLGDRVEKGQVLALVEPALAVSDVAQLTANTMARATLDAEFDLRELDLRTNEIGAEQQGLQATSRLTFARQALARIERLRSKGLGAAAELEEAQRDVAVAERDVESQTALRTSFGAARDKLREMRSRNAVPGDDARQQLATLLVAPIAGEIVEAPRTIGEHIEADTVAFRVLDASRVWVTAEVPEFDLARVEANPHALLELVSLPGQPIDIVRDLEGKLAHTGRIVEPETRTVTLRYECANREGKLLVGQLADVFLAAGTAKDVVIVPEESIVKEDGRPVAFVLISGETFQKRYVELGVRDGRLIEIRSGIRDGERVVSGGAYLVKLAAASPASFGEGHAH